MKPRLEPSCAHRFLLESSKSGPLVKGVCSRCGEERVFDNYFCHNPHTSRARVLEYNARESRVMREVPLYRPTLGVASENFRVAR